MNRLKNDRLICSFEFYLHLIKISFYPHGGDNHPIGAFMLLFSLLSLVFSTEPAAATPSHLGSGQEIAAAFSSVREQYTELEKKFAEYDKEKARLDSEKTLLQKELDESIARVGRRNTTITDLNAKIGRRDSKIKEYEDCIIYLIRDSKPDVIPFLREVFNGVKTPGEINGMRDELEDDKIFRDVIIAQRRSNTNTLRVREGSPEATRRLIETVGVAPPVRVDNSTLLSNAEFRIPATIQRHIQELERICTHLRVNVGALSAGSPLV